MSKRRLCVSCRGVILTGGMVVSGGVVVDVVDFSSCIDLFANDWECYHVAY